MERDFNAPERDCGETALEFDWLQLSFSLFSAFLDNLDDPPFDVLKRHPHRKSLNVDFMRLEKTEHICEAADDAGLTACQ